MKKDLVEALDKQKLFLTAKKFGIKTNSLSLMQIREALVKAGDEPPKKEKAKREKAAGPREGSKMAAAVEVYRANKDKPRKDILKLFVDRVKLTKAGANTYYAMIKKTAKG